MLVIISHIDFFILLLLAVFGYVGYRSGFYNSLLGLSGFYIGVIISFLALPLAAKFFYFVLQLPPNMSIILGFSFVFALVMLLHVFFMQYIHKVIKMEVEDKFNRLSGIVIGLYKGSLIVSLLALGFCMLPMQTMVNNIESKSIFLPRIKRVLPANYDYVRRFVPGLRSYQDSLEVTYKRLGVVARRTDGGKLFCDATSIKPSIPLRNEC